MITNWFKRHYGAGVFILLFWQPPVDGEQLRTPPNFQYNKNEKGFFDKMKDFFHG